MLISFLYHDSEIPSFIIDINCKYIFWTILKLKNLLDVYNSCHCNSYYCDILNNLYSNLSCFTIYCSLYGIKKVTIFFSIFYILVSKNLIFLLSVVKPPKKVSLFLLFV